jgi:hypothetical protein
MLIIILLFVGGYVGYQAVQKHAYIVYAPLFVESYNRSYKSAKDSQSYPGVRYFQDSIFTKKQNELQQKLVVALIEINQNLNLSGDFRKALDKYKASKNPDIDFYLLREMQETLKFLPPVKWSFSKAFFYFAATNLCAIYDELIALEALKNAYYQKFIPLESVLSPYRK